MAKGKLPSSQFTRLDRLVGLVVKASASTAKDPRFESRLRWDFFRGHAYISQFGTEEDSIHQLDRAAHVTIFKLRTGGRNSSVGSAWARCPRCRGFDPPLGTFSGRGDFSLGVNMGSNSIPPKTPSDESINRGLVCAHMHFIARTQKILTFMS